MKKLFSTAAIMLAIDQFSKWLVVQRMDLLGRGEIDVFPPYLVFRMAWNRGINFGLFGGGADATRWLLIVLALGISAWVVVWVLRERLGGIAQISAGLLVGGALGNVADRLIFGAVRDFLNMSCCGFENPFAFNIADIAVFAGALGLMLAPGHRTGGKTGTKTGPGPAAGKETGTGVNKTP